MGGWLCFVVFCLHFFGTMTASVPAAASQEVQSMTVKANEPFSLPCDGAASKHIILIRFLTGSNRRVKLYDSRIVKNDANTLFTVFPNGTIVFISAQLSDDGEYQCIVFYSDRDPREISYRVLVQNETDNNTEVKDEVDFANDTLVKDEVNFANGTEVDHKDVSNSYRLIIIGCVIGVFTTGAAAAAAAAGLFLGVYKWKKQQQASTNDNQMNNDCVLIRYRVPSGNVPEAVDLPTTRQNNGRDTEESSAQNDHHAADPLLQNGHLHISV